MRLLFCLLWIGLAGCSRVAEPTFRLFTDVAKESGIDFQNNLTFTERFNPYTFRNFYNGAGVAVGDINNDGLLDIYFAGNQVANKLFLNQGNMTFKDITASAGVACEDVWSSGVTFADVNGDGLLDIYVCKSGDPQAAKRYNELFINNGDLTFTERSKEYGLDVTGLSVQAAFFDYDKDGDLDCYLLTNSIRSVGNYDLVKDQRNIPDAQNAGNKFYKNENGKFVDFSKEAGIYRSNIGFGLGITLGDFNEDGWADIFVSNDFFERDYLYINNTKGGFTESLTDYFDSISMGSMGADLADLDNDGQPELFVTEMLPDSLNRRKTKIIYENWDKYQLNVSNGYHHQFARNVFQKKIGNGHFVEIGRMAGVAASEWSWGALLFDMDNDGNRDIFVANGIYKDLLDRDYLAYTGAEENIRKMMKEEKDVITSLINQMPSSSFPNYAYRNTGNLQFQNNAAEWGLAKPMYSSGSAYGDFDNDGDLDLVINNINSSAALFKNNTNSANNKNLTIDLSASTDNRFCTGSRVLAYAGTNVFAADNFVTRGFQSCVQPKITLGLGNVQEIDSLKIIWPDHGYSVLYHVKPNQQLKLKKEDLTVIDKPVSIGANGITLELVSNSLFKHKGSGLIDFNRERLLPMMYSNESPALITGDINKDGVPEVYVGGGKDQHGGLISFKNNRFTFKDKVIDYALSEETRGTFFDADNDGDEDYYLASGGRFYPTTSSALFDKLFLNDGTGKFTESVNALQYPSFFATSVAVAIDFDGDGDQDIFAAERCDPFHYGKPTKMYAMANDGKGKFSNVSEKVLPAELKGMVTDAVLTDFNNDHAPDLVLVGDWMPITFLQNTNGRFVIANEPGIQTGTSGWWKKVSVADLNNDSKPDFVIGNYGLNSFFQSGDRMYINDFDHNGSGEQIYCTRVNEKYYPILEKDELVSQMPALRKQLLYYKDYASRSIDEIFEKDLVEKSMVLQVDMLQSIVILSSKKGYTMSPLPKEAQYSALYALLIEDVDRDGVLDLIAGGNQYLVKPQFGRADASRGWFFKGRLTNGKFNFENGIDLNVRGQIRDIKSITEGNNKYLIFAKYDDDVEVYKVR